MKIAVPTFRITSMVDQAARSRRVELWIFVVLLFTYAYFFSPGGHNAAARYDSIRSFLEDGTLIVDRFCYNSADLISVGGHYYSSKAPGMFWMGLPPFLIFSKLLEALPEGPRYQWTCYLTNVFSNGLISSLAGVLIYRFLRRGGGTLLNSVLVTASLALGTMFFPNASLFFSHNAAATCLFAGFYLLMGNSPGGHAWRAHTKPLLAGFLLGFAVSLEYPAALGAAIILVYGILRGGRTTSSVALLAAGGGAGLLSCVIYNLLAFHQAFFITYAAYAHDPKAAFVAHSQGILGVRLPIFDASLWPFFWDHLLAITIGPLRGIFLLNPVVIIAFSGLLLIRQSAKRGLLAEHLTGLCMVVVYLVFNASYGDSIVYWGGGYAFGPRHLTPIIPFLALPMLNALDRRVLRAAFWPLFTLSVFFCWMAVAIDPLTPYSPDRPIQEYYLPKMMTRSFAMETSGIFSDTLMTGDSVALNLGKAVGFSGWSEFFPLMIFWVGALCILARLHLGVQRSPNR